MTRRLTIAGAVCLAGLLALGACGRRGDLEPPPGAVPQSSAKDTGCDAKQSDGPQSDRPIDAGGLVNTTGNTNRMPDTTVPPC
ncbi:MAG TPA: lipoprotein [Parvibaculum sp.]